MKATITSVEGNRQWLDGGSMFGNVPRPVWEKWFAPDELGRIPLACRCLLIECEGQKILCETGIGAFFAPKLAARFGVETPTRHRLVENLGALGIKPEDIDYVVLSHLHFDHAGGLLTPHTEGRPPELIFTKAKFLVGTDAWARAEAPHPRDRASFIPELGELLRASGRLVQIGRDPLPEIFARHFEFLGSEGHTPGQLHALFKGDKESVLFCADLIPGRPWVHLPITMGYDRYPEKVIDEKSALYPRALREGWWLFFTHDPGAAGARLGEVDHKFAPVEVQSEFRRREV